MSNISVSIIIPVYNEVATLNVLLRLLLQNPLVVESEIILVDAGSTDGTRDIIKRYSNQNGFITLLLPRRAGKGLAVREGLKVASGSVIIIQDGDLEYTPADYPALLRPILQNECDFVIGSRRLGAGTWNFRSFKKRTPYLFFLDAGDYVLTHFFRFIYNVKISDPLTMFKVFKREHLPTQELTCEGFDFDWEVLCKLLNARRTFVEVPVSYTARTLAEGKKLRAWREGIRALRVMFVQRFS